MGKNSSIQWTTHTFNPWRGCTKISPGCANCYAAAGAQRNPALLGVWGDQGTRVAASESKWSELIRWNREARESGERHRVFVASYADVFEQWAGDLIYPNGLKAYAQSRGFCLTPALTPETSRGLDLSRRRLFDQIDKLEHLDFLLLTKRPESIQPTLDRIRRSRLPRNVWMGTTVENQAMADLRIPELLKIDASIRFLSVEPMLEAVDLTGIKIPLRGTSFVRSNVLALKDSLNKGKPRHSINWVICGGESGYKAREFQIAWARSLAGQCRDAGVPFFMKQLGFMPMVKVIEDDQEVEYFVSLKDGHGGDWAEWPQVLADLKIRQDPELTYAN